MVLGIASAGVAAPVLAACGSSGSGGMKSGETLTAKVSDIPVGGGKIFKDQQVVITQPESGKFAAYTAVCTHQGCIVDKISDGFIVCPCHGSHFAIASGDPTADSQARSPLPAKKITESGGTLTVS